MLPLFCLPVMLYLKDPQMDISGFGSQLFPYNIYLTTRRKKILKIVAPNYFIGCVLYSTREMLNSLLHVILLHS